MTNEWNGSNYSISLFAGNHSNCNVKNIKSKIRSYKSKFVKNPFPVASTNQKYWNIIHFNSKMQNDGFYADYFRLCFDFQYFWKWVSFVFSCTQSEWTKQHKTASSKIIIVILTTAELTFAYLLLFFFLFRDFSHCLRIARFTIDRYHGGECSVLKYMSVFVYVLNYYTLCFLSTYSQILYHNTLCSHFGGWRFSPNSMPYLFVNRTRTIVK